MDLYATGYRQSLRQVLLPSLLINILSLAVPLTVLQIYDRILANQSYGTAVLLIFGAFTALIMEAFLRYVRTWFLAASSSNTEKQSYSYLVEMLNKMSPLQLKKVTYDGIQDALDSVSKVKDLYSGGLITGLIDLPFVVIFLSLVYYVGGELVLVPIAVWLLTGTVVWYHSSASKRLSQQASSDDIYRTSFLYIFARTLQGIKRQAIENKILSKFKFINKNRMLAKAEEEKQNAIAQECIQLAAMGTSVVLVIVGSLWVLDGSLTTGGLAACSILSGRAVAPLSAIVGLKVRLTSLSISDDSIKKLVNAYDTKTDTNTLLSEVQSTLDSVEIINMTLQRYGREFCFNASMNRGDIVRFDSNLRFVPSHCLSLLAKVDTPSSGDVSFNTESVFANEQFYRQHVAYVGEHGMFLSGSLLDNLCGFDPRRSDEVNRFAEMLGLDKIITRLAEGPETKVGYTPKSPLSHGGIKLSNLVSQLACNKAILLLDKPEVHLDLDSITKLADTIKYLSQCGVIVVMVSYHPSITALANKTIAIDVVQGEQA